MKPFIVKARKQNQSIIITIPAEQVKDIGIKDKFYYWITLVKEVKLNDEHE